MEREAGKLPSSRKSLVLIEAGVAIGANYLANFVINLFLLRLCLRHCYAVARFPETALEG